MYMGLNGGNNSMTQYSPESYWHKRGADYQASGEVLEAPEIENLEKIANKFIVINSMFLEVGSGYGRIYNALKRQLRLTRTEQGKHNISDKMPYTMCDFVESMRYNCLRNTGRLPDYWNGITLPYPDKQFDFVISFSVLLHVPPADIETVFAEHVRVCKKYFFIATYNGGLDKLAPHCFEHDYKSLFEKHDLKITDEEFFQNGLRVNWLLEI